MKLPLWKKTLFTVLPVVLLFVLVEATLALLGYQPRLQHEDPFVGFSSRVPLFTEGNDAGGLPVMVTNANKRAFFNLQTFPRQKPAGTYRIFCLGGSTTYGRPFSHETAFSGWLQELLEVADDGQRWEVINAGGISYASYRVALLMEELATYQPDLFIVYSGHNEFLEERTYKNVRDMPAVVRTVAPLLASTRTWAALTDLFQKTVVNSKPDTGSRSLLPASVQTKLDNAAGPNLFQRDDPLRDSILEHYRFSLRRMIEIARASEADIIFVTPAANLKDWSPFKSQHTDGLDAEQVQASEGLLATAEKQMQESSWEEALQTLDRALAVDPRSADLHYARGQALLAQGETTAAREALTRSLDEDVCPLRALTALQQALADVARKAGVAVVDYAKILDRRAAADLGHGIPGEEYFLDHVHPTVEAHGWLALALVETMMDKGLLHAESPLEQRAIDQVTAAVESRLDPETRARALANLAMTLNWAGKQEESRRLAFQALESGEEEPTMLMMVGRHYAVEGKNDKALEYFRRAVQADPSSPVIHSQLGLLLAGRQELEAAAGHFFLATLLWEANPAYHQQLAHIMTQRGHHENALASLLVAQRLDPGNVMLGKRIDSARAALGGNVPEMVQPEISVTRYDSGYPRTIFQTRPGPTGRPVPHGIWTEWYDEGRGLKRFADYVQGVQHGIAMNWDASAMPLERTEYKDGHPVRP